MDQGSQAPVFAQCLLHLICQLLRQQLSILIVIPAISDCRTGMASAWRLVVSMPKLALSSALSQASISNFSQDTFTHKQNGTRAEHFAGLSEGNAHFCLG